jgi:hypothetical protein
MKTPVQLLSEIGACSDAIAFVRDGKFRTLQAAWTACPRGDWLLWYAGKKSGAPESAKRRKLVLAACECAREVLPIFEKRYPSDNRVRACIETAEKWARGETTIEQLRQARAYAADAAYAAADAAYAAYAAADAAAAAYAAAYAAAAYAAAAYAAAAYAADAARLTMRQKCADIVRKHYPKIPR